MWRISFTLLIVLSSFIGGLLFWQWNVYSEHHSIAKAEEIENATQKISVKTTKGNLLEVTQTFYGLKNDKEYRVVLPELITEWNCLKADGSLCDSHDENPHSFLAENQEMILSFQIQLENGSSPFLLNHWLAMLQDAPVTSTAIEVIDLNKREGTWAAGLPLKSHRKLEIIDYYFFEGKSNSSSLFWQPSHLEYVEGNQGVNFYSLEKINQDHYQFKYLQKLPDFPGLSIIISDSVSEVNGIGLMIADPDIEQDVLERKVIYNYFLSKASDSPIEERWLIDVLTSLLTGQDSNVPKGNNLIAELKRIHSEEELTRFLEIILLENKITPAKLDELLGTIVGKKTHFFTLNKNEETQLIPLYYSDVRRVFVQGKLHQDIEILEMEGDKLIPFIETFQAFGFEVKALEDKETILLNRENNSYRFYINQNIFIYNEVNYGLLENPLSVINGRVFLKTDWLKTIFKIQSSETQEEIHLSYPLGQ